MQAIADTLATYRAPNAVATPLVQLVTRGTGDLMPVLSPAQIKQLLDYSCVPLQAVRNAETGLAEIVIGTTQRTIFETKYLDRKYAEDGKKVYLETPAQRLENVAGHIALASAFHHLLNQTKDETLPPELVKTLDGVKYTVETKQFPNGAHAKRMRFHTTYSIEEVDELRQNFKRFKRQFVAYVDEQLKNPESAIAKVYSRQKQAYFDLMANGRFFPNSPTLMNAGKPNSTDQFSACFVLPIPDNLPGILKTVYVTGIVHQTGGGTGYDWSDLRPAGSTVSSTQGKSSGPSSFAQLEDKLVDIVVQGGTRAGAMMAVIDYDHPDVFKFVFTKLNKIPGIVTKLEEALESYSRVSDTAVATNLAYLSEDQVADVCKHARLTEAERAIVSGFLKSGKFKDVLVPFIKRENENYNISLRVNEAFADAVINDKPIAFNWKGKTMPAFDPSTGKTYETLTGRQYLRLIAQGIRDNGDPGLINFERINKSEANPVPAHGDIRATNPCGEQPLYPYDVCNLGSIDLSRMLKKKDPNSNEIIGNFEMDWDTLRQTVRAATTMLDDVKTVSLYPVREIEERVRGLERIGLGIMGLTHALIKLGLPYESKDAVEMTEKVMTFIRRESFEASRDLAKDRGVYFDFGVGIHNPSSPHYKPELLKQAYPNASDFNVRNAARTTIAPTGTIGNSMGVSNGIEPLFACINKRSMQSAIDKIKVGEEPVEGVDFFYQLDPLFFAEVERQRDADGRTWGHTLDEIVGDIKQNKGSVRGINYIPERIRQLFVSTMDISADGQVAILDAAQRGTENAVSKTINVPKHTSVEEIEQMILGFLTRKDAKGFTVYRDGSKDYQIIDFGKDVYSDLNDASLDEEVNRMFAMSSSNGGKAA